jgi:hypothetical protein
MKKVIRLESEDLDIFIAEIITFSIGMLAFASVLFL